MYKTSLDKLNTLKLVHKISAHMKFVFDVHVTVHRDNFLTIKPNRCTNYSNLFLE
jgi:hypothetical protein